MEFVFVVSREKLFPDHYPHGVVFFGEGLDESSLRALWCEHGFFVERAYAERTPSLKQVIPYTVVTRDGDVLLLTRTKRGGDARLHDKLSIGVGGHVEPHDLPAPDACESRPAREGARGTLARDPVPNATRREVLEEELAVDGPWSLSTVGLLNDDSNAVGAVHVGLVQVLEVEGAVQVRETDTLHGSFVSPDELVRRLAEGANFETWSSLLIPQLDRILQPTRASSA